MSLEKELKLMEVKKNEVLNKLAQVMNEVYFIFMVLVDYAGTYFSISSAGIRAVILIHH